jgi:outer membrane protein
VKKSVALLIVGGTLLFGGVAFAELKLGYVDVQRAIRDTSDGKKAYKKLKRTYNRYQRQIKKKEDAIKKFQAQLKDQAMMLTDDAKKQKAEELQKMVIEFQQTYINKQRELQGREAKVMGPIINRLVKVVQTIGQSGDYTMIFEKGDSRLLWAQPALDLTNEVIRRYNSRKK